MKKKFIVMCAALLPLASCGLLDDDKEITPSGDDNYVSVSVSDVKDGYFKLDFECGEGTQTIEYAVCRAVNMKTDSVAFKAGELDGVQRCHRLQAFVKPTDTSTGGQQLHQHRHYGTAEPATEILRGHQRRERRAAR